MFRHFTQREYDALYFALGERRHSDWPKAVGGSATYTYTRIDGATQAFARDLAWVVLEGSSVIFNVTETQAFPTGSFPCFLQLFQKAAALGDGTEPAGLVFEPCDDEWLAALMYVGMTGLWDMTIAPLDGKWLLSFSNDEYVVFNWAEDFDESLFTEMLNKYRKK